MAAAPTTARSNGHDDPPRRPRERIALQVLDVLRARSTATQQDVVADSGLSRGTVASTLAFLQSVDLVRPAGLSSTMGAIGGRPAEAFALNHEAGVAIGVDVARSTLRVLLRDLRGEGSDEVLVQSDLDIATHSGSTLRRARELVAEALAQAGRRPQDVVGVCVGISAAVDRLQGRLAAVGGLPAWKGVGPADELQKLLGWTEVPFFTENNANLCLLAELDHGVARPAVRLPDGHDVVVLIRWASGVGGAIAVDRRLVYGARGLAGEFGHWPVPGHAPMPEACPRCRQDACVELVAGGDALCARLKARGAKRRTFRDVVDVALAGGAPERAAIEDAARAIGESSGPLLSLLNPRLVVLAGPFGGAASAPMYDLCAGAIRSGWRSTAFPKALDDVELVLGEHSEDATALGGVAAVLRSRSHDFFQRRLAGR